QCVRLAEQAVRERQNHLGHLEALLAGCRVPLPGDRRASGESGSDPDHQSSFLGMDPVIPNARLCKALLDRVIDRAHIIETASDSYRFRRMLEKGKRKTESTRRAAARLDSAFRLP